VGKNLDLCDAETWAGVENESYVWRSKELDMIDYPLSTSTG